MITELDDIESETFTTKQLMFCFEYLVDLNATQAAIRAGYSEGTARQISSQLMQRPHIKAKIEELNLQRLKKAEVTSELIISEFMSIVQDDIKNYVDLLTTKDGKLKIKWKDLKQVNTQNISEIIQDKNGIRFKRYSRENALGQLGKYLGLFDDRMAIRLAFERLLTEYSKNGLISDEGLKKIAEFIIEHHAKKNV